MITIKEIVHIEENAIKRFIYDSEKKEIVIDKRFIAKNWGGETFQQIVLDKEDIELFMGMIQNEKTDVNND
jgi:hypothetical protein